MKRKSLTETHPEIAAEWDYESNGDLLPSMVSKGMVQKVWWVCSNGHHYYARVDHRCSMNSGCSICAGKQVNTGINDLQTVFPGIAVEWDSSMNEKSPQDYLPYSNKTVAWVCPICGRSYRKKIIDRTLKGTACPRCCGERSTSQQEQTLLFYLSKATEVLSRERIDGIEVDVYMPSLSTGVEYNGEYYHAGKKAKDDLKIQKLKERGLRIITMECGREREVSPGKIVMSSKPKANPSHAEFTWGIRQLFDLLGLPMVDIDLRRDIVEIYSQYVQQTKANSLMEKFPEIAKEWDYDRNINLKPAAFRPFSNKRVWWKCSACGNSYDMQISNRTIGGSGCPYCVGKRIKPGKNDICTTHPEVAKEWDYNKNRTRPEEYSKGSDHKVNWICSTCGYEWRATISSRTQGCGCPMCAGRVVKVGNNDLMTVYPEVADLWDYEKNDGRLPSEYTANSNKKVWWSCNVCGYSWESTISNLSRGRRCPKCAKENRVKNRNQTYLNRVGTLAEKRPVLLDEWEYSMNGSISPYHVTPGSSKKVWWRCKNCNHVWQAIIYSRSKGRGCPVCARKRKQKV